jgi:uncharacterized repeat protein (TIGR03803 family)
MRRPLLALLICLLWAAALVLPALGAQAGVVFTTLHSFQVFPNGANPQAALVQGSDGNFYGTTYFGGTNSAGTVFRISTNGSLTSLYSFSGGNDGANPSAPLVQGNEGNFYGTTQNGGTNSAGTVFKVGTSGALTSLYSFTWGNDGSTPAAGLVQGNDGNFYGTTSGGGAYRDRGGEGYGTVFKISTNGAPTSLHSFGGNDGAGPNGLVQGSDGSFYGTTVFGGGTNNRGTVFKITTNLVLTSLYSFTGGRDGAIPLASLVQGSDGYFYGTASGGGTSGGAGTVFRISTNGALTSLYSFTGGNDGANPEAGLVQGSDGSFYGTTFGGGTNGDGTVFKINANGALTSLYSFARGNDGGGPQAALVQGSDGSFYGTTAYGGAGGGGTVFRLTIVPEFQAVTLTNGALSLTWSAEAGGTYQLQYTSDLSSTNWTNGSGSLTAAGATLSATDSVTNGPRRFYRVALSP